MIVFFDFLVLMFSQKMKRLLKMKNLMLKKYQSCQRMRKLTKYESNISLFQLENRVILVIRISHSEIERRRREKMNRYIDEIAQLLSIDATKKLDKLTVLRAIVDTIKALKGRRGLIFVEIDTKKNAFSGVSLKTSLNSSDRQRYLNDEELFELLLATIDQLGTYFFLIIECQTGRVCYVSSSIETILRYKPVRMQRKPFFVML